jgi:hypothetical protein
MPQNFNRNGLEIPCEALASANAVMLQAVVEILSDKGLLSWKEVLDRVEKLTQARKSSS